MNNYKIISTNGYYEIQRWNHSLEKWVAVTKRDTYQEAHKWIERRVALV